MPLLTDHEIIISQLLGIQDSESSAGLAGPSIQPRRHKLTEIPRHNNKVRRKRCVGCYKLLTEQGNTPTEARKKRSK